MDRRILLLLSQRSGGLCREEGQTLPEYGLILLLIAIALMGAIGILTNGLNGLFHAIGTAVSAVA